MFLLCHISWFEKGFELQCFIFFLCIVPFSLVFINQFVHKFGFGYIIFDQWISFLFFWKWYFQLFISFFFPNKTFFSKIVSFEDLYSLCFLCSTVNNTNFVKDLTLYTVILLYSHGHKVGQCLSMAKCGQKYGRPN